MKKELAREVGPYSDRGTRGPSARSRAEPKKTILSSLPREGVERLEVLGEDAQRTRGVAFEKCFVPVRQRRCHDASIVPEERPAAKPIPVRPTSRPAAAHQRRAQNP